MGDQEDGHAKLVAQLEQQFQNLRLDGDVEGRGRLVRNQEARAADQGHRDHHPLAKAARELVGILIIAPLHSTDADQIEHFQNLGTVGLAMEPERFADLEPNLQGRVQAGHRLLEDHADLVAADLPHAGVVELEQIPAVQQDFSALDHGRRHRQQAHDRARRHALAAAALAHQADDPAGADRKIETVDHARDTRLAAKAERKILDHQQRADAAGGGMISCHRLLEDHPWEVEGNHPVRLIDDLRDPKIAADAAQHVSVDRGQTAACCQQVDHGAERIARRLKQVRADTGGDLVALLVQMPADRPWRREAREREGPHP